MPNRESLTCSNAVKLLSRQTFPALAIKGDVNHETLLALEELSHSEVFDVQSDWSDDIKTLRQLAVHKPHVISEKFIFQHFTTLRLVDRNINEVDRGLLRFTHLNELSLTGNSLSSIKGAHLPRSLTVLQLFANKFTDLNQLAVNPPPNLQHLGVGYNQLTDVSSYLSPFIWPNLLSLDLSHNNIGDVRATLDCVAALPSLRNLSLLANPLTLAPGYTGCTLDLLPHLQILDDTSISDDDRLNFTGISREPVPWDEAIFTVSFPQLTNLREPPPNEPVDEAAFSFPVQRTFSYFIRFSFLSDETTVEGGVATREGGVATHEGGVATPNTHQNTPIGSLPNLTSTAPPSTAASREIEDLLDDKSLQVFQSDALPWETNLQFDKPIIVRCSNLPSLQVFLSEELQFTLIEKVVESFTTIAPPEPPAPLTPESAKAKKGKDNKEDKKKKKEEPVAKQLKDKDGNVLKWVESVPNYNEIAHIRIKTDSLLNGLVLSGSQDCTVTEKPPTTTPNLEEGRSSVCSNKGKKKGGADKKKKAPTPVPMAPPEPLKLDYTMDRVCWSNVEQCRKWTLHRDLGELL